MAFLNKISRLNPFELAVCWFTWSLPPCMVLEHMNSVAVASICHNSPRNCHRDIQHVCRQLLGQLAMKCELWDQCFVPTSHMRIACIHLQHPTNESQMAHRPQFCCPDLLQTNWIVPPIVMVIDPIFGPIVLAEQLSIVKQENSEFEKRLSANIPKVFPIRIYGILAGTRILLPMRGYRNRNQKLEFPTQNFPCCHHCPEGFVSSSQMSLYKTGTHVIL